ncbi:DUF7507 domain-containing protein [Cecembia lonarensis]|uniref:PKD domain-containing protein n=1 Tax=Cecembia lonarensis (strain CCUG 58316 / KCTC 22772 / LW9) TaxID=1225176 RepID=K1LTS3_CECL9|nr:gliding motility-associated C-terminal domain-containing protein [Cecembia lonarensis]EKB47549.1 hypothetical protein B879_03849 [Cecembia lonarensis LW9]
MKNYTTLVYYAFLKSISLMHLSLVFVLTVFLAAFSQSAIAQNTATVNSVQNNFPIQEVTLIVDRSGANEQVIVQNTPGEPNPLPEDVKVEVESILLQNGDRIFGTTRVPIVKSANPLLGSNIDAAGIRVIRFDHSDASQFISHANNLQNFLNAMAEVVSTPDLRSYWDIGGNTILTENPAFVDVIYPNQIPSSGYLMVSERNGNSGFDILPLDKDGNIIANAIRILIREQFDWNSGVNHQIDIPDQKQWLTVFKPELFQTEEPIYGFRLFDIGESDGKIIFFAREVSAAPDNAGPIFGFFGEENVINIFENDELDGRTLDPADINLTVFDDEGALANGFLILDTDPNSPTFGRVSVPAGTPAGIYTFEYEIEDKLDGRTDRAIVTIRVVDPIDGPEFPDCREGFDCNNSLDKISLEGIYLSDAAGNPISEICESGSSKEVYLALSLASYVDQTLFESRFIGDLSIGESSLQINAFLGNIEPNETGQVRILSEAFSWNCGDQIKINDILIIWLGEEPDFENPVEDCTPYEEGKCIAEVIIGSPLTLDFDWTACEEEGTFIFNFTSSVAGGVPVLDEEGQNVLRYTYAWDFNNNGTIDSNEANPTFVYGDDSAEQVRLVVTDGSGNSVTKIKQLEYPTAIEVVETIIQPREGEQNGSIQLDVSGGTGELVIEWRRGEELIGEETTLENIGAGQYSLTITDANGCVFTKTFDITEKEIPQRELEVSKVASTSTFEAVGQVITYTITVVNTGREVLNNINVEDPLTGLLEEIETLAPGAENAVVFTTEYIVSQVDMDRGEIVNVVLVNAGDVEASDTAVVEGLQQSGINVQKTADKEEVQNTGEVITYTITVENTGNTTLTDVVVKDPLTGMVETIDVLLPGEERIFTTQYTVTLEDEIALVPIVNTVLVSGTDPNGEDIQGADEIEVEVICVDKTRIQGIIFNSDDGTPLARVPVLLIPQSGTPGNVLLQVTGDDGRYFFTGIAPGSYLVQVQDANININKGLFPVDSSLLFTDVEVCNYVIHDFPYTFSDEPVIGDFVWYDLNGNGVQDEWFDANNDGVVTQNVPDENGFVPFAQWEWIDLNGDGRFDGPENEGELNKAGVGNALNPNIIVEGPDGLIREIVIGLTGYYRTRPEVLGEFTVTLDLDENLADAARALAATGRVKVLPNNGNSRLTEDNEEAFDASCGVTTDNPYEFELTAANTQRFDIDFGIRCEEGLGEDLEIIANDDDFGVLPVDFTGVLGNILDNDLLEGQRPDPSLVDFIFTDLDDIIGLNINENGELSLLIPGVNEPREYVLRYILQETANPSNQDDAIVIFRIVEAEVDLSVTKTSDEAEIFEGDEFVYRITITNNSEFDATNVLVTDDLPNGISFIGSTFTSSDPNVVVNEDVQGNRVTWTIPVLSAGAVVEITLRVSADALSGENPVTITNVVTVVGDQEDPDNQNNTDSDTNTVRPFFIPNVITPDGDGKNDTFEIKGLGKFVTNEIIILNRYGDHVFERFNYANDWDAPGQVAGTYMYVLRGIDAQGRTHEFKGWIQVIK